MDITSIANAALASVTSVPAPQEPSALVTERFNAMMSAGTPAAPVPASAGPNGLFPPHAPDAVNEAGSLGNQILAGLKTASTDYAQKWQDVTAGLNEMARNPSAANMLKVQSELLQVSVQYELVGKAVSRSTQNIDTLVRMS